MTKETPEAWTSTLYEQDYSLWLEKTATLLQDGRLHELDIPNLIEEIEDMGRSEKRAIYSNLKTVLMHLLKYRYQPEKRSHRWRATIVEHRQRIKKAFQDSPSLKRYFNEAFDECYQEAKELAAAETGLSMDTFPHQSPLTTEDALKERLFTRLLTQQAVETFLLGDCQR